MAQHKTAKQIALELGISYHAVESHLKAARRKLGAASTAEALERLRDGIGPYYGDAQSPPSTSLNEQYYGSSGLSGSTPFAHFQPAGLLDEATLAEPSGLWTRIWEYQYELTPGRTLMWVGVTTIGLIVALALLITIGTGVNSLFSARG